MSKQLGIGVRVWIGWCPDDLWVGSDQRLKVGVITGGPIATGEKVWRNEEWHLNRRPEPMWEVAPDGCDLKGFVVESLLTPIDDDETREREIERAYSGEAGIPTIKHERITNTDTRRK